MVKDVDEFLSVDCCALREQVMMLLLMKGKLVNLYPLQHRQPSSAVA
jgi:hypothetical protein